MFYTHDGSNEHDAPMHQQESTETNDATQPTVDAATEASSNNEMQELQDKYFHLSADFANYKRRVEKEREQWTLKAQERLLHGVLAIADDVDRALQQKHAPENNTELAAWIAGFEMIGKSLHRFLEQAGVQEITQLTEFDPNLHEALAQVAHPDKASGTIVDVVQKGYMYKGIVLRPAKVTVAA